MTMDNNQDDNQPVPDEKAVNITESQSRDDKNEASGASGDPGRTLGSAEGDEETIDEDIRQKEAEGKL